MKEALIGFRWNILSIVFPRLCVVGLNVAQPFLVNAAVKFVQSADGNENKNDGFGLIGAYAFVYIGSAVRTFFLLLVAAKQIFRSRLDGISISYTDSWPWCEGL